VNAASFLLPVRVYYEDTDAGGVVYYANYLRYLERARTEWLRHLGTPRERLRAEVGWVFVVSQVEARYLRPARLDDLLTVHCSVREANRASVLFEQSVERDGETLFRATVRVACVDSQSFKPQRIPADLLASLTPLSP
jgi:acyl-CoA thioester hydrolase